jgi:hypothetical protein
MRRHGQIRRQELGESKRPDDLMHEDEVYEKYPRLFADRELREARKAGVIRWYDLRKGPHYTDAQIMEYLSRQERSPCPPNERLDPARDNPTASSRSAHSGSGGRRGATISSITGMTLGLEEHAARQLDSET